jgi:hypothetical protein
MMRNAKMTLRLKLVISLIQASEVRIRGNESPNRLGIRCTRLRRRGSSIISVRGCSVRTGLWERSQVTLVKATISNVTGQTIRLDNEPQEHGNAETNWKQTIRNDSSHSVVA